MVLTSALWQWDSSLEHLLNPGPDSIFSEEEEYVCVCVYIDTYLFYIYVYM